MKDGFLVALGFLFGLLGSNYQQNRIRDLNKKDFLLAFRREFFRNMVLLHLATNDISRIRKFELDCWNELKMVDASLHMKIHLRIMHIEHVNKLIEDYLVNEQLYTSDFSRRNPDNSNALKAKRDRVINSLQELSGSMDEAFDLLEQQLVDLKLIKEHEKRKKDLSNENR